MKIGQTDRDRQTDRQTDRSTRGLHSCVGRLHIQNVYKRMVRFQKINKKFISHLTRSKRTPSAATTVHVFYALIIILQCLHPGSHDTHPHDIRIRPI
jgi:hypothetical protein